ncbi:MAG: AsnC family transcriptional regulator [Euryarchaeota archaeon]|nr:AsnC family transcriptional regulator [Euryarchaeota archaeon]
MGTAFILIKTIPGKERDVYLTLSDLECVLEVHVLYGEHDLIARIGANDSNELANILLGTFRTIEGIRDTETLITVDY